MQQRRREPKHTVRVLMPARVHQLLVDEARYAGVSVAAVVRSGLELVLPMDRLYEPAGARGLRGTGQPPELQGAGSRRRYSASFNRGSV